MPVIKAAKKRGLHVLVADDRPNAPGLQLADKLISIYRYNPLALFRTCKEQQVDAVVSAGADKSVWIASAICNILKLPCSVTPRAAKLPLRKSRMRNLLRDFHIPCPRHTRVLAGVEPDIDGFEFPLVVKPEDGIAQAGVAKVENLAALHDAMAGAIACSESGVTVIEEFVEGIELGVNGLVNPTGRQHFCPWVIGAHPESPTAHSVLPYKSRFRLSLRMLSGLILKGYLTGLQRFSN